jgi:hypothetical protein
MNKKYENITRFQILSISSDVFTFEGKIESKTKNHEIILL